MQRIVDDILDYSKLDANKLQLETTSFNLRDLLDSVTRLMEKPAEGKGLRLNLSIDPAVRLAVRGDPVRLRQVLTNLLSNALKFTERGSVSLSVTRKGETRTQHDLHFEVKDTGIGISKTGANNLFRPFSQADASTTRLYGGTGLGLVICKRIIDLMGGQIGVESEPGRGSTFWFDVPLLKAAGDIQGQRADINGAKVLLLSNDTVLRQKLQQAMPGWGAQLTEADTTQDALSRLRSALGRGSNWAFDLLMVDLNSARSTAIALHRNLRRSPELEDLRVVYLLGNEAAAAELNDGPAVLMVPRVIGPVELRTALAGLMARPVVSRSEPMTQLTMPTDTGVDLPEPQATPAAPVPSALRGRVLLVEDNPVNQMVAQRLIGMLGLTCETADNGEKALERMMQGNLDAVLMDCQMPVKDGYNASREWRQHEAAYQLAPLPIIAMTANAMAGDRQKCLDAGMDDYLSKPVDRRLLETTLAKWLQRSPLLLAANAAGTPAPPAPRPPAPSPTLAAAPRPAPAPATATVLPVRPAPGPSAAPLPSRPATVTPIASAAAAPAAPGGVAAPPVLAMEVVEELRSVMGPEYLSLIKLFLEDAPTHIQKLEQAAASNDVAAMVAPAHTLKSASANLGALALSAVAKRIELGARGEALSRPTVAVLMLENEFKRAQAALQGLMRGG
jgi:CheY-like chemotaxis protein/HPt (histidine-containing phosphotransfer) domain-containing protein/two-component sensor histidine kinase